MSTPGAESASITGQGTFHAATGRNLENGDAADKPHYRRYQQRLLEPHCGRSVLEVGAGLGDFAAGLRGLERLVLTDLDADAVRIMGEKFAARPEVEVAQLDLDDVEALRPVGDPVESVLAINVLEHFEDDVALLRGLSRLVAPGGTIVLWVPAFNALYSDFDRQVGHARRYTPATLRKAARAAGLEPARVRAVNLLGGLAWWAATRRGGVSTPNGKLVGLYDRLIVPASRVLDRIAPIPFGQSVVAALRVPAE